MKCKLAVVSAVVAALAILPCFAYAEEATTDEGPAIVYPEPNFAADAKATERQPPTIPHAVQDDADGAACNTCHSGSFKAPHPDRLNCTQCHVPGKIVKKAKKPGKTGK